MTVHIYSTLTAGNDYVFYKQDAHGLPQAEKIISVKGGANVPDKVTGLVLPCSHTELTDEEYEALKEHSLFKLHVANGFIRVSKTETKDTAKATKDLVKEDDSAPLTPEKMELEEDGEEGVTVYKPKKGRRK